MPSPRSFALPYAAACAGIAMFSAMDAVMKGLVLAIGAYNAVLWRILLSTVLSGIFFFARREPLPARAAMRLHLLRGAISSVMALTFFWGIARVPLAEGIALSFIAPLITLYLAAVVLGERVGRGAVFASILGLAGVLVILSGRIEEASGNAHKDAWWGIGAILVSALFYAYNLILQRQQAQVASPAQVVFFQNLVVGGILGLAAPFFAIVPGVEHVPEIGLASALAMASLFVLSWAYARAEAQLLVSVEYTAFIWAALFGWLTFGEELTIQVLFGAVLIVAGCIVATRKQPGAAAEHIEAATL